MKCLRKFKWVKLPRKEMPGLKGLKVLRPGLHLGTVLKNRFEPSHALALALRPEETVHTWNLDGNSAEAANYLKGGTFQAEGEKLTDDRLVAAPLQYLAGKEIDDGYRQHVADDTDPESGPVVQSHTHGNGDTPPQFHQRDHGYEEAQQVFFQHFCLLNSKFQSILP